MKMTTGKKRFVAVLLAVLMVFSIIPFAALAANAATITGPSVNTSAVSGTYAPGSKITVNMNLPTVVTAKGYPTWDGMYYRAQVTEHSISGVVALDADYSNTIMGVSSLPTSQYVSVSPVYGTYYPSGSSYADYVTTAANGAMNSAKLTYENENTGKKATYTAIPSNYYFGNIYNRLDSITVNAYGLTSAKTVYLYAHITSAMKEWNGSSVANVPGETLDGYYKIGSVTIQANGTMTLNVDSIMGAGGQSILLYPTVSGISGYDIVYDLVPRYATGFKAPELLSTSPLTYRVAVSEYPVSGNSITVNAYAMKSGLYVYRNTSGGEVLSATKPAGKYSQNIGGVYLTPVMDSRVVMMANVTTPITSIRFAQSAYTCEVSDSFYANVTITPSNATGGVKYYSSNPAVATVTDYGYVTGVGEGSAVITAYAADGTGARASASVVVTKLTAKLILDKSSATMEEGEKLTLTATLIPTTLTNKTVLWTSSNTAVAKVENGVVTAVKEGTAVITATYAGNTSKKAVCTITVKKQSAKITVKDTLAVKVGETANVDATIENSTNQTLLYVSDNTAVAKVDAKGNVTGVKAGSAMITVMSAANSSVQGYCVVTVTSAAAKGVIEETGKYVANSKYYRSSDVTSADVKTAIAELKGQKTIDVTVKVTAQSNMNKVVFTRYAAARLAKYADTLTVNVNGEAYVFDSADLAKMDIGRPVYVYVTPDKVMVKYKNASGVYKTIKVTPEAK